MEDARLDQIERAVIDDLKAHPEKWVATLDDAMDQLQKTGKIVYATPAGDEIVIDYTDR